MAFYAMVHPEDRERVRAAAEKAWQEGGEYVSEHRIVRPDGAIRWVEEHGEVERDAEGRPVRMVGLVVDVTERVEAEALRRLQSTALEAAGEAVVITDVDGAIQWVNPAFTRITGYSLAEVRGQNPRILKSGRQDQAFYKNLWETILAGKVWRGAMVNRRKDGVHYHEQGTIAPVKDSQGRITHFVAVKRDVTREREAEARARREAELRRSIIETSHEGIGVAEVRGADMELNFILWNRRLEEITGYTLAEFNRLGWRQTVLPDEELWPQAIEKLRGVAAGLGFDRAEWRMRRKDGAIRTVLTSTRVLQVEDGVPLVLFVVEDITDQRAAELRRKEMEAHLRQQEKLESLGLLAGGVAHEINNPINGIMNYAEIIRESVPENEAVREMTGEITKETQRVANLVKSLLTFARQDKRPKGPARPAELVEGTLTLFRTIIKRDRIDLQVDVPEELPPIFGHGQQIQQVLMNLLTNARDALNEKYPGYDPDKIIRLTAAEVRDEQGRWVRFIVEDHGPGIPAEVRERMFEPFFTTKPEGKGTGLGLGLIHGIVTDHGGRIDCETEVGRFTRFTVDFPASDGQEEPPAAG